MHGRNHRVAIRRLLAFVWICGSKITQVAEEIQPS